MSEFNHGLLNRFWEIYLILSGEELQYIWLSLWQNLYVLSSTLSSPISSPKSIQFSSNLAILIREWSLKANFYRVLIIMQKIINQKISRQMISTVKQNNSDSKVPPRLYHTWSNKRVPLWSPLGNRVGLVMSGTKLNENIL